ncbi:MAG TPA: HIT domain-containing protein [Gammaproteobacteria bacterium]|nr:HIT domain-containing protein [Gammaproteobacteria bacterium]
MTFHIDERLAADSYRLGKFDDCQLLLSRNALFPWFILVPVTQEIEFHKLGPEQQSRIQRHINAVAQFIEEYFSTDKINIANIGNIVSQLHIHIIGRKRNDACWPGVVWGTTHFSEYKTGDVIIIKKQLADTLTFFVPD